MKKTSIRKTYSEQGIREEVGVSKTPLAQLDASPKEATPEPSKPPSAESTNLHPDSNVLQSEDEKWDTPAKYVEAARTALRIHVFDSASSAIANQTVPASQYFTREQDGLVLESRGCVFLNSSNGQSVDRLVRKLLEEYASGRVTRAIVMLSASACSTKPFAPLWNYPLCFTNRRIQFLAGDGQPITSNTEGSVFVYFGPDSMFFGEAFKEIGQLVRRRPQGGDSMTTTSPFRHMRPFLAAATVSLFRDEKGDTPFLDEWTYNDFAGRAARPQIYSSKQDMPLIKLAAFGQVKSKNGSLITDNNLLYVSGIEADYDAEQMPMHEAAARIEKADIEAVLYTSPSHTEDKPRWRVLCVLSKEYEAAERYTFVARLNGVLGGILADESFIASQGYYFGQVEGAVYDSVQTDGTYIDLLAGLDERAIGKSKGDAGATP